MAVPFPPIELAELGLPLGLAWAVGAYLVGYRLIRSPLGWTVASLARPVAVSAGLVVLILAAGVSFLLPVRTAQVSDHRSAQAAPASSPNWVRYADRSSK